MDRDKLTLALKADRLRGQFLLPRAPLLSRRACLLASRQAHVVAYHEIAYCFLVVMLAGKRRDLVRLSIRGQKLNWDVAVAVELVLLFLFTIGRQVVREATADFEHHLAYDVVMILR